MGTVVDRLAGDEGPAMGRAVRPGAGSVNPSRRRANRRLVGWAGLATGALAAAVAALVIWSGSAPTSQRMQSSVVAEMRTPGGSTVGQAVVFAGHPVVVTVALDVRSGVPGAYSGSYDVLALRRDGQLVTLGRVDMVGGRGSLQTSTPLDASDITSVEVESPGGQDLCAGRVPRSPPRGQGGPPQGQPGPPPGG